MRQTGTNVCEAGGKSCRVRARTESELVRSVLLVAAVGILALPPTHISGPRREGAAGSGVTSGGAGRGGAPASGQLHGCVYAEYYTILFRRGHVAESA